MKKVLVGLSLALCAGAAWGQTSKSPASSDRIAWVKDAATAQKSARAQKTLVLQFLMLGDLPDPNC